MYSRGNNDLVDTDDSDEGLETNLHTPERSWLQYGNNMSRALTNRYDRNTVTLLKITDKGRSKSKLEKQNMSISLARQENYMAEKKIKLRK